MKIKTNTILTISTPTKSMCEKVLETLVTKLPEQLGFNVLNSEKLDPEPTFNSKDQAKYEAGEDVPEAKAKHFTGHLELELEFNDSKLNGSTTSAMENLYNFVFEFSPASIEIIDPSKLTFDISELNGTLNLLAGVIVANASQNKSLEFSFRNFCEKTHKVLLNNSKPGKKLREIDTELQKWYAPARK